MSRAGLDEDEDTFAPTVKTARRRATWLGVNLMTAGKKPEEHNNGGWGWPGGGGGYL
jgi:hypothetical protein